MWNIKHLGYAILKRQNKIKIIRKLWQFPLFKKKLCCFSPARKYRHLPGGPCSKTSGKTLRTDWLFLISLFRQLKVTLSLCTHHPSHWAGRVPRECLRLRQGAQGSRRQNDKVRSWKNSSKKRCDPTLLEPAFQCQQNLLALWSFFTEDSLPLWSWTTCISIT